MTHNDGYGVDAIAIILEGGVVGHADAMTARRIVAVLPLDLERKQTLTGNTLGRFVFSQSRNVMTGPIGTFALAISASSSRARS